MQLPYRRTLVALCGALLAAPATYAAAASHAAGSASSDSSVRVYKFTDDHGVVHYGDTVPSEYSQSDRQVLNGQGVVLSHSQGRQSDAQLSADAQSAQAAEQRAQHDRFLLTTYASAAEIERLRDERIDQMAGQIKASSAYIDSLGVRLAALEQRAMHFEPYSSDPDAARMPDELAVELVRTVNESRLQRAALDTKRQAEDDMRVQFAADLQRYRELTSPHHE